MFLPYPTLGRGSLLQSFDKLGGNYERVHLIMNPKRILVIDDDDGIREVIQVSLEFGAGWQVLTAASGREGLVKAQTERPDAIILDMVMPGLDGRATWTQLKTHHVTQDIPTILLTARDLDDEHEVLHQWGVKGIIPKPFEPFHLVTQIRQLLQWQEEA